MPILSAGLATAQLQQQTLAPQQQYALKILHMSAQELLEEAARAAEENPLIECDVPKDGDSVEQQESLLHEEADAGREDAESVLPEDRGPLENAYSSWSSPKGANDEESPAVERVPARNSLRDDLLAELGLMKLDRLSEKLVACLIEELDDSGFLTASIDEVAESYEKIVSAPAERWQNALDLLKTFDPPGVGASGPTEALELQVQDRIRNGRVDPSVGKLLIELLDKHLQHIASNNRKQLLAAASGDEERLDQALSVLKTLNPHPTSNYSSQNVQYVVADIIVRRRNGCWQAELNAQAQPSVRITALAQGLNAGEASPFGHYLAEARKLVSSIEARQTTLLRTAQFAVSRQQEFFSRGRAALVPLSIAEAAQALEVADSTVSRAVSGKFFQCPLGVFELRSLFVLPAVQVIDELGMTAAVSPAKIRARICELVAAEPQAKPLSDQAITEKLNAEGFNITRRTVAKYRDLEGIPAARLRSVRS